MVKKIALLMTIFFVFDRFIQHKINDDHKQRLAALHNKADSLSKHLKRGKSPFAKVS